jgi:hypothetical protein
MIEDALSTSTMAAFIDSMSFGVAVRWLHELQATPVTVIDDETRGQEAVRRFAIVGLEAKVAGRPVELALSRRVQRGAARGLGGAMAQRRLEL